MPLLEVKNLTVHYGSVLALDNVSFHVDEGEIVAIIGPNGAGKSTALKAICNLLPLKGKITGDVIFEGKNIKRLQPYELVKKGICLVPEGRRVFGSMTVLENLEMGAFIKKSKKSIEKQLEIVFNLFPKLKERKRQRASTLSSGEQQMLAIGRALMLKPKLLLIDEPSFGLSPNFVEQVFEKLKEINKAGATILLVEQNARATLQHSQQAYVFETGHIKKSGSCKKMLEDKEINEIFLRV